MPNTQYLSHPDSQPQWSEWAESQTLHVATAYSNPFRWATRRELADDFRRHMQQSPNVKLYVGELAYGDRPHEITNVLELNDESNLNRRHHCYNAVKEIQLRTTCELFHKENILNRVIQTFPPNWEYGAIIDADFHFSRHDWALEAIQQLQHYDWVQLFSSYTDLGGGTYGNAHLPIRVSAGFAYNYIQRGYKIPEGYKNGGWKIKGATTPEDDGYYGALGMMPGAVPGVGATGGAWAFRRSAFDVVGGLLDKCVLGHGDWFMAFGLVGEDAPDMHVDGYTDDYRNTILAWQRNAAKLKKNIGYVDGFAVHHFHGSKMRRAYSTRDMILVRNGFSPTFDLKPDYQGIYQLTPDKPALRDDIRRYFISRTEDDPNLYGSEKPLV